MTTPAAWERQNYESEDAWRAFQTYRDASPRRRSIVLDGRAVSPILIEHWISAHFWKERCLEYDRYMDRGRVDEIEAAYRETAREVTARHMQTLSDLRNVAAIEAAKLLERVKASSFEAMKPRDLVRLADVTFKLERLVRGESTENVNVDDKAMQALSDDRLAEIERMLKGEADESSSD
jgi:hypothetical protein